MNTGKMTSEGWFYGWEKPGREQFMVLIEEWARAEGGNGFDEATLDQLDWNDLDWSQRELIFGQYGQFDNGSPDVSTHHYRALPDLVCTKLAGHEFEIGEHHPLVFQRAYNDRTPELISWPPIASVRGRVDWHWSYVLTPKIKTIVGCPEPFLYFHPSVRRWVSSSLWTASYDPARSKLAGPNKVVFTLPVPAGASGTAALGQNALQDRTQIGNIRGVRVHPFTKADLSGNKPLQAIVGQLPGGPTMVWGEFDGGPINGEYYQPGELLRVHTR